MTGPGFDKNLQNWAMQTIAFAISLRAENDGADLGTKEQVAHAATPSKKICQELWDSTRKKATTPGQLMMAFTRSVFDWVADHLGNDPADSTAQF